MRGRVLILLIIIIIAAGGVGALLLLNSSGDTTDTATPEAGQVQPTAQPGQPTFTPLPPPVTEIVDLVEVVIALQNIPRGSVLTADDIDTFSSNPANALLSIRRLPLSYAPETSIQDPQDLVGCVTRTDIPRESIIVQAQVVPDPNLVAAGLTGGLACQAAAQGLSRVGSDLALFLPPNYTAISVPLDPTGYGQVAYGLKAGDRVDVYMSFLFIDVDEEFQTRKPNTINYVTVTDEGLIEFSEARLGREEPSQIVDGVVVGPSEDRQRPRLVTQRTVTDALVLHVGWVPEDGVIYGASPTPFETPAAVIDPTQAAADPVGAILTLESIIGTDYIPVIMVLGMTPQDALTVTWAIDAEIPVRYGLRPVVADDTVFGPGSTTAPVTLLYILETYGIDPANDAAKLPFAIEPAVEDIRRFDLRNLRTFVDFTAGFQAGN
ncbi:MAG: hypothetical protein CUN55_11925 [Phototrophicales bacterium]|nr:MAG: hypothetical protein CUN55_11925 [Phototrophicales bacterium]